jgi:hypothetical protein
MDKGGKKSDERDKEWERDDYAENEIEKSEIYI